MTTMLVTVCKGRLPTNVPAECGCEGSLHEGILASCSYLVLFKIIRTSEKWSWPPEQSRLHTHLPLPPLFFFLFAIIYIYGTRVQSTCYSCIKGILSEKFPFEKNPSSKIGFKRKLLLLLKKNNTFMKLKDVRFQIIHGQRSAVSPFVFRPQDKKQ